MMSRESVWDLTRGLHFEDFTSSEMWTQGSPVAAYLALSPTFFWGAADQITGLVFCGKNRIRCLGRSGKVIVD